MSAAAITGRLWRVGPLTINVPSETHNGKPIPAKVTINGDYDTVATLDSTIARAMATFLVAAADVADAIERDRRTVQRIEVQTRARLRVLAQQAEADL